MIIKIGRRALMMFDRSIDRTRFFDATRGRRRRSVRTDGRRGLYDLTHLDLVQNRGLAGVVEAQHHDTLLLLGRAEQPKKLGQTASHSESYGVRERKRDREI